MKLTVVIPTKNRHDDLKVAIKSILNQTKLPDQIIIIDQSDTKESLNYFKKKIPKNIDLNYVYDNSITGLVEAKHHSLNYVDNEIVTFLEDDIKLDINYIHEIHKVFQNNSSVIACSGVITNATSSSLIYILFHSLTHFGLFRDDRPSVYYNILNKKNKIILSNVISGGLSSWKFSIFKKISFDIKNKFHMIEDLEFCYRFNKIYNKSLFIISNAKLEHFFSPVSRDSEIKIIERKIFEFIIFYKKNKMEKNSLLPTFILLLANFIICIGKTVIRLNLNYIKSYYRGVYKAINYKLK